MVAELELKLREKRQLQQNILLSPQQSLSKSLFFIYLQSRKEWQKVHYIPTILCYQHLVNAMNNYLHIIYKSVRDLCSRMKDDKTDNKEPRYKIILVGDVNVGKTALFWQYTQGEFLANKSTLVTTVDFKMKNIVINNSNVKLYLWDTAGSEQYRSIVTTYFKGCHGVAVVFDLSRETSFKNAMEYWIPLAKSKTPNAVYILIGNKSDLDIRVSRQQAQKWAKQNNIHYIETSVKLNKNVVEAFDWLGHRIHEKQSPKVQAVKAQSFSLEIGQNKLNNKNKKKCCK